MAAAGWKSPTSSTGQAVRRSEPVPSISFRLRSSSVASSSHSISSLSMKLLSDKGGEAPNPDTEGLLEHFIPRFEELEKDDEDIQNKDASQFEEPTRQVI